MANRQCAIAIQYTQVAAVASNYRLMLTRSSFPSSANEIFDPSSSNQSQSDGGDIRFYSDSSLTTQLACHVVAWEWDSSSGAADANILVFVKVPSISNTVNTTIYIAYNTATTDSQPAVTSTYGSNAVWSDCEAAWIPGYGLTDVTGNGFDFTATNSPTVISGGPLGKALQFVSSNSQYLNSPLGLNVDSQITVQSVQALTTGYPSGNYTRVWELGGYNANTGGGLTISSFGSSTTDNGIYIWSALTTNTHYSYAFDSIGTYEWDDVSSDISAPSNILYKDSVAQVTDTTTVRLANSQNMCVGAQNYNNGSPYLDANVALLVVAKVIYDQNWVTTNYNNQSSPGTFAIAGTPTATSTGNVGIITAQATLSGVAGFVASATGVSTQQAIAGFVGSIVATSAQDAIAAYIGQIGGANSSLAIQGYVGIVNAISQVVGISASTGSIGQIVGSATLKAIAGFLGTAIGTALVTGVPSGVSTVINYTPLVLDGLLFDETLVVAMSELGYPPQKFIDLHRMGFIVDETLIEALIDLYGINPSVFKINQNGLLPDETLVRILNRLAGKS